MAGTTAQVATASPEGCQAGLSLSIERLRYAVTAMNDLTFAYRIHNLIAASSDFVYPPCTFCTATTMADSS
jgi:hypothetical protein